MEQTQKKKVIPPFPTGCIRRIHAVIFSFCVGVMPPMPPLPCHGLRENHDRDVRAVVVISPKPLCGVTLRLLYAFDDVLIQPLVPDGAVVRLDVSVLRWLAGLDVLDGNPMFLSPFRQLFADVFRAIVDPDGSRLAAPFDNPFQTADHPLGRQGCRDIST